MKNKSFEIDFLIERDLFHDIVLSGGEPTEHPEFVKMVTKLVNRLTTDPRSKDEYKILTITTNGLWSIDHPDEVNKIISMNDGLKMMIFFQVSTDKRYYPTPLDTTKRVFRNKFTIVCTDCVKAMYPQGRARHMEYDSKSSRCYNVIAITKQLYFKSPFIKLRNVVNVLKENNKCCTPAIHINGGIGLGESDLCPIIASIYDSDRDIINKILSFECKQCGFINDKLPDIYKMLLIPVK